MYVVIYDKKSLEIIARPTITNLEEFKENPSLFYPNWDLEKHIWDETEYQNPVLENGRLRESTKEELYKAGKYALNSNEIVENGKIKTVELSEFEYIDNNKIKLNRDKKIESIKEKLNTLKVQHSEKEFIFLFLIKNDIIYFTSIISFYFLFYYNFFVFKILFFLIHLHIVM